MPTQFGHWGFAQNMINVHFVVLATRSDESVFRATAETAVNNTVTLSHPGEPTNKALVF